MDHGARIYGQLLILRCQTGDESALRELIACHSPGLRFFIGKIIGRMADADDLLQETWIDVYHKINRLEKPAAFTSWLYRIARDKAYRELRRRSPGRETGDAVIADLVAPEEDNFTPEETACVRTALDQLPLEQREVLLLRFIEDMSYEQIAEVIGTPTGTVRSG